MSLTAALNNSANSLTVLQQALDVIQNNVTNSSTPGYAAQKLNITAQPFDVASGAAGGIAAQGLISSRDSYADSEVQRQLQVLGGFTAQAQGTSALQSLFDVTGTSGVPAALNNLYTAFSAWSASPTDASAEQNVISAAGSFANAVSQLSQALQSQAKGLNSQIGSTVGQINSLAGQIRQYNQTKLQNPDPNPELEEDLPTDDEALLTSYRQAARQGYPVSQFRLGSIYREGRGRAADPISAYVWFELARVTSEKLNQKSKDARDQVAGGLSPEQLAEAHRRISGWLRLFD